MRNLGKADTRQLKLFACFFGKVIVYFKKNLHLLTTIPRQNNFVHLLITIRFSYRPQNWFSFTCFKYYADFRSPEAIAQRCSVRKGVLRNFTKFTGKQPCQSPFLNKVAGLRHRCLTILMVKDHSDAQVHA